MIELLAKAAAKAFAEVRDTHTDERFYFFALYTTEEGEYVCATAHSEEALARVVAKYQAEDPGRNRETLVRTLRFSAPDSPYHEIGGRVFSSFDRGRALHQACFQALRLLDHQGFFGHGEARARTVVNVVYGDMSDERWLEHAKRLNPAEVVESVLPFLQLHIPSGAVSCWGAGVYQVNALSLSADRSILAYSGSGGEVGVIRLPQRTPIYEKRRRGEHWACALSSDGARLYLGDRESIGILDTRRGKYAPFVKTPKPGGLALSADGKRLAASSWERPLTIFDTANGNVQWEQTEMGPGTVAFSPDGTWLAAAFVRWEDKKAMASVACYEASSGRELWRAPLGNGDSLCIAWSPDGRELLASSSQWTYVPDAAPTGSASLCFFAAKTGQRLQSVPWTSGIDALALAPSGQRIGLCARGAIFVVDRDGTERARGNGAHESLGACVFTDEATLVAAGRDVNSGPAIVALTIAVG